MVVVRVSAWTPGERGRQASAKPESTVRAKIITA
jgi:hypothetical protein